MRDFERGLTAERLRELFHYDPDTGVFTNRIGRGAKAAGSIAGTPRPNHYIIICVDYYLYVAHRLAWLYVTGKWPVDQIDHVNLDRYDNRWENLREATRSQNHANKPKTIKNISGLKGVCWNAGRNKWQASIMVDQRCIYLGLFDHKKDAHAAYAAAAVDYFGEFARTA